MSSLSRRVFNTAATSDYFQTKPTDFAANFFDSAAKLYCIFAEYSIILWMYTVYKWSNYYVTKLTLN